MGHVNELLNQFLFSSLQEEIERQSALALDLLSNAVGSVPMDRPGL